ncbi:calcium binding modulator protein (Alg2) [Aspergillus bombycis]|uniref:Calcium binding modulator protein (Alg2) n=1 Tax=Aspergillus bombycis TaxID=109264 RepID=A0A1F7ZWQ6_9EURO|nr:calcium binding modulator protein (Alg2) [Aspergillus bombycis]OGM43880.1 calcium binding modulator protein (Alg2) [Aspergillus bombycis]
MAYNQSYNPDALPAHAEPEQVAQMIGAMQTGPQHHQHQTIARTGCKPTPDSSTAPITASTELWVWTTSFPACAQSAPALVPAPTVSKPPPLSVPDDDPQQLFPLFRAANSSHTGSLTEMELGSALVNGDFTSFHPKTVKMMIRMFDRNSTGTISFDEFVSLWRYLAAWRELFDRFDVDRSGRISLQEFENALLAFGYRLSQPFVTVLFTTFESKGRQTNGPAHPGKMGMSFDLFVQACISLRRMTDVFKRYDDDRDGYITVSFEEFLTEILQLQD